MRAEDFAAEYLILVRRYPDRTNAELAAILGMSKDALVAALWRGRRAGRITVWRVARGAGVVELAPPGVTAGYERAVNREVARRRLVERRRTKDLGTRVDT